MEEEKCKKALELIQLLDEIKQIVYSGKIVTLVKDGTVEVYEAEVFFKKINIASQNIRDYFRKMR